MAEQEGKAAKRSSPLWMALKVGFSLVLVVGIFYYLLTGIDLSLVWAEIRAMTADRHAGQTIDQIFPQFGGRDLPR